MPIGKLVFAQLMDFLPLHTFRRCVARYPSNYPTKTFSHLDQYLSMAFAQLTFRESLRDIRAHEAKLYHLGIRGHVARSNLGDANEKRDWRIYRDFANSLIAQARRLYADDAFAVDLDNTVYALDTTTIDLSLKVFPWAHFRKAKAAVKMHTQIDLRGNIPSFIHVSDGKMHEVNGIDIMTPEPGSFSIMDRGFLDFARLYRLTQAGAFFVIRPKSNTAFQRVSSRSVDKTTGFRCHQTVRLTGVTSANDHPQYMRYVVFCNEENDKHLGPTAFEELGDGQSRKLEIVGEERHERERGENANLDRHQCVRARCHRQKTSRRRSVALHNPTGSQPRAFRENTVGSTA